MKKFIVKFKFWFYETFGKRDSLRDYCGYGNFTEERGWWLFGKWVSYDGNTKDGE